VPKEAPIGAGPCTFVSFNPGVELVATVLLDSGGRETPLTGVVD
jgi:hypothetical protein